MLHFSKLSHRSEYNDTHRWSVTSGSHRYPGLSITRRRHYDTLRVHILSLGFVATIVSLRVIRLKFFVLVLFLLFLQRK